MSFEDDTVVSAKSPLVCQGRRASLQMHNQFLKQANAMQSGSVQDKILPPRYYRPLSEAADSKESKETKTYGIRPLAYGTLHLEAAGPAEAAAFYNAPPKFIVTSPHSHPSSISASAIIAADACAVQVTEGDWKLTRADQIGHWVEALSAAKEHSSAVDKMPTGYSFEQLGDCNLNVELNGLDSEETEDAKITRDFLHLPSDWNLPRPGIIFSVTGSATTDFDLEKKQGGLQNWFKQHLHQFLTRVIFGVAMKTKGWIIDGGSNSGIMKALGDAREYLMYPPSVPLIGIASHKILSKVKNCPKFDSDVASPEEQEWIVPPRDLPDPCAARLTHSTGEKSCDFCRGLYSMRSGTDGVEENMNWFSNNNKFCCKLCEKFSTNVLVDRNHSHFFFVRPKTETAKENFGDENVFRRNFEVCSCHIFVYRYPRVSWLQSSLLRMSDACKCFTRGRSWLLVALKHH
jgi:hypothetical protein